MAVDPYAACPCGSGKKLKFCCFDLVGEIEKIHRMVEGDQPRAALSHVEQTLAKHPRRASLLDLKATLELSLEKPDDARATIAEFLEVDPHNPAAHAGQAMQIAATGVGRDAVAPLQRALELVDREMPLRVFEAVGVVGRTLLSSGHVVAAQAHLWLHVRLAPPKDSRALELLVSLNHYSGLPLLVRDQLRLCDWPADAPWHAEAVKASELAAYGKWQQAVGLVDTLGGQYGAEPALVYNRAVLAGYLADDAMLVAGLHAYSQLEIPFDEAVEAEAIAQLLDPAREEERLDTVVRGYETQNLDTLVERLTADVRVQSFDVDPAQFAGQDQPRPRHTFVLLDRPLPATGVGIAREDVPILAGVIATFGRQTDRPERLELTTDDGPNLDATLAAMTEIAGDEVGEIVDQRSVGSTTATEQALNWRWHFPIDTPPDERRKLLNDERHRAIVERWPDVPRPGLDGKTPRDVASEEAAKIPLLAAVLILEQGSNQRADGTSVAVLRDKLGLPQAEPIDPAGLDATQIPMVRISRLEVEKLADEDLVQLYRRSVLIGANVATAKLAQESLARPTMAEGIPRSEAYRRLIALEDDSRRTLELIAEAREGSTAAGESTAPWDLAELELHIDTGDAQQAQAVLSRIEQQHLDDPQVAAAVYRLLYETGVISPEQLSAAASAPPQGQVPAPMAGAAASDASPASGQIWTPDGDRPASKGKSSLWTPS